MRIFVTGGTGFIGRHVVERLLEGDNEILLLTCEDKIEGVNSIEGDLSDIESWKEKLENFKPEVCVHLAWEGIPDYGYEISSKNLKYGLDLFSVLAEIGCSKIIGIGSCWEYENKNGELKEGDVINPSSPFNVAKNSLRLMGETLANEKNIQFIWTRLFYVYGPGQKEHSLIPHIINCIKNKEDPEIKTPNAKNDFVYVGDVADAIYSIVENGESSIYNIGSGKSTSVKEIVEIVSKHYNFDVLLKDSESDVDFWADISKTKNELDWEPKTDILEGIKKFFI
ncbi:MAG: hypothetical protein CMH64_00300 [Nanoarchaeota archaeon]|nr:hypothetical protein [Nanoarchaeota archaeon]